MNTTTVIIGAGHAGLAMSRRLTERSIDHVVLERGQVANSWRTERWDSLRLLTPNWQNRLPGTNASITHDVDPDGFMTMPEVAAFIDDYATTVGAPVKTQTTVTCVSVVDGGYEVRTDRGVWNCATLVLASGACNVTRVPDFACAIPASITQVTARTYRSPEQLSERGVLVVGGSATGVQLADEIHRSGRSVTLAVGEHVRMPRVYRGKDVFWWLDNAGVLDEAIADVGDIVRARNTPSPQLIGTPERRTVDLNALRELGVEVVGRLGAVRDGIARCSGGLANVCRLADLKMNRLLRRFDQWADIAGIAGTAQQFAPTKISSSPTLEVDLIRRDIGAVVWATGYRPDYSWLDVPVFDHRGSVRHDGGVVSGAPGMYLLGTSFLRRRRSTFISGAAADSEDIAAHLDDHLRFAKRTRAGRIAG